jgi:hypothetical protein
VLRELLDAALYSSVWLAATAAALCAAVTYAIGGTLEPLLLALAASGTLVVYNVDRLRDLERDCETRPTRTAFVARWQRTLTALVGLAGIASLWFAWKLGPEVLVLLAPAALLGLAHRRIKHIPYAKGPYIAAAWLLVVVGLPWLRAPAPEHVAWTSTVLFFTFLANALASSLNDDEAAAARFGPMRALSWARRLAVLTTVATVFAPESVRLLLPIPALTSLALLAFRGDERYGLLALDGALLVGACVACALATSL